MMNVDQQFPDDPDAHVFLDGVRAPRAGMPAHPRRPSARRGLVPPARAAGGGRRYSSRDVDLLREVQRLSQDEGVNLAGIKRIIDLTNQVDALQRRVEELAAQVENVRRGGELVHVPKSSAMVVWQPRSRRGG